MSSRALRSRVWSCSELEAGNSALLNRVKEEPGLPSPAADLDAELEKDP